MTAPSEERAGVVCIDCGKPAEMTWNRQCRNCFIDSYDDPDDEPEDDGWDDCGMTADGTCMQAGTEYCDWDCPHNR
ncbi:hypothetical protein [Blastomonas sp. CCH2-A2]|uniref:hypothetical protein n=1 Tax=Blastomonas sp. CCH2-A2 TaxID=1768788 RepID=UPI000AF84D22|nr:hypothetical protein [Blastomonas sp. CCH2-A2]